MNEVLEILKYTIPALVVLLAAYLIVNKFLITQVQRKQLAIFGESQDITLRMRLQAYERLVLFIERITPRQLIPRIYTPGMTATELRQAMVISINAEYEHNLSQQLYVSKNVWETVKGVKEQELAMVNGLAGTLLPDATAKDLHARILEVAAQQEHGELPTDVALHIINDEAKRVLAHGSI